MSFKGFQKSVIRVSRAVPLTWLVGRGGGGVAERAKPRLVFLRLVTSYR